MRYNKNKIAGILGVAILCIIMTSCSPKSPAELSEELIKAKENQDLSKMKKLLENGANPYVETKGGKIPFKLVLEETIQATLLSKMSKNESEALQKVFRATRCQEMLKLMGHYGRRIDRKEIIAEGTLSMNLEMISWGQMVAHTIFKTDGTEYELKVGSYETEIIGMKIINNQLTIHIGGRYRVVGTLKDSNTIETDSLEYIDGGSGSSVCPISNYLPSTMEYSGF